MALKRNLVANYASQGWRALMMLAFVPVYIRYMGIEAYGLIGIFTVLQAWLALLDFGFRPMLVREMARFTAGAHTGHEIRDLLRSVEWILGLVAILVTAGIALAAEWLATHWLNATSLSTDTVATAFCIMGALCGLRLLENIYVSALVGLQKQVLEGSLGAALATVRAGGAVAVLAWIAPTADAFFLWQGVVSVLSVALFSYAVYRSLPAADARAQFSTRLLRDVWTFGSGMLAITFLALLLTQVDKVLLSRLLPLQDFGYYALAGAVASVLYLFVGPIATAFYPRFTEFVTRGDAASLQTTYHQAAQLNSVMLGSTAAMLIVFGESVLTLWMGKSLVPDSLPPLLSVLLLGTFFNGLMFIPYHLQLAYGWTSLTIAINSIAVLLLVPTLFVVIPRYGAIGAAWLWTGLNASYLIFSIYCMHRRLLRADKRRWYVVDVGVPASVAFGTALACRSALPDDAGSAAMVLGIAASAGLVLAATTIATPLGRSRLRTLARASR